MAVKFHPKTKVVSTLMKQNFKRRFVPRKRTGSRWFMSQARQPQSINV